MKPSLPFLASVVCLAMVAAAGAQTISFVGPRVIPVGASAGEIPFTMLAGDFNGDGKTDFLVQLVNPNDGTSEVKVLLGDGKGYFSIVGVINQPTLIGEIFVADVNGDGKDDIITVYGDCNTFVYPFCQSDGKAALTVYLNDGTAHFTISDVIALSEGYVQGVVGDFNQDGKADIVVSICNISSFAIQSSEELFTSRGNGTFAESQIAVTSFSTSCAANLVAGDFNGDGHLDLAAFTPDANDFNTYIFTASGKGDGTFAPPRQSYYIDSAADSMLAADLNGDGKTDLVISLEGKTGSSGTPRVATLLAKPGGGFYWDFALSTSYYVSTPSIALADLNGDGKLDLMRFVDNPRITTGGINIYLDPGLGGGRFAPRQTLEVPAADGYWGSAVAPLAKGQNPSLLVATGLPNAYLFINTTK